MRELGTIIGRLLITLALIVQIVAPVGSSVAMVTAATDPLADVVLCITDHAQPGDRSDGDPLASHHRDACALCQLVNGGGFAPPPLSPIVAIDPEIGPATFWSVHVEPIAVARLLDQIRGRAPPAFS